MADVELLPLLARGRHRSPRRGACFMELASYLAGERWSDAPACTDPHLAALARLVNDLTSDAARPALARLVPGVIGVNGLPATFAGDLALLATVRTLGHIPLTQERAVAAGALRLLEDPAATASPELRARVRVVLGEAPHAVAWAWAFLADVGPGRYSPAAGLVEVAVRGLSRACVPDVDDRLRTLLAEAVELARTQARLADQVAPLRADSWRGTVAAAV